MNSPIATPGLASANLGLPISPSDTVRGSAFTQLSCGCNSSSAHTKGGALPVFNKLGRTRSGKVLNPARGRTADCALLLHCSGMRQATVAEAFVHAALSKSLRTAQLRFALFRPA